jgi:hypothetical protein
MNRRLFVYETPLTNDACNDFALSGTIHLININVDKVLQSKLLGYNLSCQGILEWTLRNHGEAVHNGFCVCTQQWC